MKDEIEKAIIVLQKALKSDPEYFYSWQANIAMNCDDAINRKKSKLKKQKLNKYDIHEACNEGAIEFLNILIKQ